MSYKSNNLFISKFIIKNYRQISQIKKLTTEAKVLGVSKNSHKLIIILLKTLLNRKPKLNLIETRTSQIWGVSSRKDKNCLDFFVFLNRNLKIVDTLINPFKLRRDLYSQSIVIKGVTSSKFDYILDALNLEMNMYNFKINLLIHTINFWHLNFLFKTVNMNIE